MDPKNIQKLEKELKVFDATGTNHRSIRTRFMRENKSLFSVLMDDKAPKESKDAARIKIGMTAGRFLAYKLKKKKTNSIFKTKGEDGVARRRPWVNWEEEFKERHFIHLHNVFYDKFLDALKEETEEMMKNCPLVERTGFNNLVNITMILEGKEIEVAKLEHPMLGGFVGGFVDSMGWHKKRYIDTTVVSSNSTRIEKKRGRTP